MTVCCRSDVGAVATGIHPCFCRKLILWTFVDCGKAVGSGGLIKEI